MGAFHVYLAVAWALALLAVRANIVGTLKLDNPHCGEQLFGAVVMIMSLRTAAASHSHRMRARLGQQTSQHGSARPMHAGARSHLDSFQVCCVAFPIGSKDYLEKRVDFACDLLMNSSSRFFPPQSSQFGRARPDEDDKSAR